MQLTELTQDEKELIITRRKEQQNLLDKKLMAKRYLKIAHEYIVFMQDSGLKNTYSIFCGNFGYIAGEAEHRPHTWRIVTDIIKLAIREAESNG
jgi:hypothetical protein